MKGFFRALAKPVTAPVAFVRKTARLLTIRSRADEVLTTAEEAEANPALYRDVTWWSRLVAGVAALVKVLPIPEEVRNMERIQAFLINWKTTLGGIAALTGALALISADPSAAINDPKVRAEVLGMLGLAWAALNAKDHNVTGGTKAATVEAEARVPEKSTEEPK